MIKTAALLLLSVAAAACMESGDPPDSKPFRFRWNEAAEVPPESDRSFLPYDHVGLIVPDMAVARIENLYGSDALESRDRLDGDEAVPGYVLFPGTYDELAIQLGEDKQPNSVSFRHPRTRWHHAATGLSVGTELHELREMNGEPFSFTGFGWDRGGTITDWNGGVLKDIQVRLTYAPERIVGGGLPDTLLGERLLSSDSSSVQGLGLTVREITVPLRNPADSSATE
ncbi:hypothetical protein [Lewinella sp. IMCC34191]|uniref:hypothetical protein n=1 Tax=Lewinella sp. IMCC34191 TaxID=2259172 RepID=UPI0013004241|nr:hypothetical protein [Lewinella sp. IMCC34191]